MKKLFILAMLLSTGVLFSVSAKERNYKYDYQEAEITYHNIQVYKVLDHRDAYIVMYAKGSRNIGTVTIPKKWYSSAMNSESKLNFRALPKGMNPYMTIIKRQGSFERVFLTMPTSKAHSVWGVADVSVQVDDLDKETLEITY